jgi:hypothetical protein
MPTMNETVQKAIRVEHSVLRTSLSLLDQRVLARVGAPTGLRGVVGRGIEALDSTADRLLARTAPAAPVTIPAEEVEHRAEHLLQQQEQHTLAGELAEDDELRRVQAELKAKHQVEAQQEAGYPPTR